jgi:UDP:flavonoid glycosyltransferase YjiC (YdhE family)
LTTWRCDRSMRFLFTALPGSGHIHPLIPTARALTARGHDLMFATAASSMGRLRGLGFEAIPVGPDWLEGSDDPISSRLLGLDNRGHNLLFVEIASMGAIPDLVKICASWRPNVILSEHTEFAGRLAGELAGIPAAIQLVANPPPRTVVGPLIAAKLDELRVSVGLPPDSELRRLFGHLYLDCVPPSLSLAGPTPLPIARKVRPVVFDTSGEETLPPWIDHLPQQPIVYATLGTVFNRTPNVLETIIEALANEPVTLIVTTGRNRDPDELGNLPRNVRAERYIPQTLLFPHCSAVISHGGFNTVIAALQHALPMYLLPLSADHPRNAQRAVEVGFGLSAGDHGEPPFGPVIRPLSLDPAQIRLGVKRLLNEPGFASAADVVRVEINQLPGLDYVADLLEGLAAGSI